MALLMTSKDPESSAHPSGQSEFSECALRIIYLRVAMIQMRLRGCTCWSETCQLHMSNGTFSPDAIHYILCNILSHNKNANLSSAHTVQTLLTGPVASSGSTVFASEIISFDIYSKSPKELRAYWPLVQPLFLGGRFYIGKHLL